MDGIENTDRAIVDQVLWSKELSMPDDKALTATENPDVPGQWIIGMINRPSRNRSPKRRLRDLRIRLRFYVITIKIGFRK